MTFGIEVNGRNRHVSIERAGHTVDGALRVRVNVDGTSWLVDVQRNGDFGLSLVFPDSAARSTVVHLAPGQATGELLAVLAGRFADVSVNANRTGRGADTGGSAHGEQKIVAPMPGRVVRVLVAEGDEVESRQPVIVVEAMKMENELRSPKAGRVREIAVAAGTSVEAGRVLVVID